MARIFLYIALALVFIAAVLLWSNRPRRFLIEADIPSDFPEQGFSHDSFEALLQSYVTADGQVDYDRWQRSTESVTVLERYLAAVARFSPDNTPLRFPSRNDELAYWMYGYNAYVIRAVLEHWPLDSVTDVKAPIEAVTGLGFFYQLRFQFGGEFLSLLAVENRKIRARYRDARIHFVLNCASESCPIARPELPTGEALEDLLSSATTEFINDSRNIKVDHDNRSIRLSTIFKWYEKDFLNELHNAGVSSSGGLFDYVLRYADEALAADLRAAESYEITFADYDWSINATPQP
ncbi:MAG: DUF547 domain-containing protein [Gammaproteobacteria bacterium]|nr:DUF547 domain-containing protein [Gammaproteobacteria bacterium]